MAKLLNDAIVSQVKDVFKKQLDKPVDVIFFKSETDCDYCEDALQLLEEVTGLSEKLALKVYDLEEDAETAHQFKVDRVPGIVLVGRDGDQVIDYGIRMSGIPSGHEFSTLIHDLILVSGRDSGLSQNTRQTLNQLTQPVHLLVFVTPT